jgi:hypothetical protein
MVALKKFGQRAFPKIRNVGLRSVTSAKLYYLSRKLNAWHSTRVMHYFENCMHTDLESAKAAAEKLRGPGSIFIITEWPAVILESDEGFVAVTEINHRSPLAKLMLKRPRRIEAQESMPTNWPLERAVSTRSTLGKLAEGCLASENWKSSPRLKDGILIFGFLGRVQLQVLKTSRLIEWQSSSIGTQYNLEWSDNRAKVGQKSVLRIVDLLSKLCTSTVPPQ